MIHFAPEKHNPDVIAQRRAEAEIFLRAAVDSEYLSYCQPLVEFLKVVFLCFSREILHSDVRTGVRRRALVLGADADD